MQSVVGRKGRRQAQAYPASVAKCCHFREWQVRRLKHWRQNFPKRVATSSGIDLNVTCGGFAWHLVPASTTEKPEAGKQGAEVPWWVLWAALTKKVFFSQLWSAALWYMTPDKNCSHFLIFTQYVLTGCTRACQDVQKSVTTDSNSIGSCKKIKTAHQCYSVA